jgi:Sigma-70, region 4
MARRAGCAQRERHQRRGQGQQYRGQGERRGGGAPQAPSRRNDDGAVNVTFLLSVLVDVETFYRGGTMATVAHELGILHGTARSRLHYALDALRQHLQEHDAVAY